MNRTKTSAYKIFRIFNSSLSGKIVDEKILMMKIYRSMVS